MLATEEPKLLKRVLSTEFGKNEGGVEEGHGKKETG